MISNADLTADKQAWLLNAVKSGTITFGQGIDEINKTLNRMDVSAGNCSSIPQLSNDEQIRLLTAVKNRELTIDEAWEAAQCGKPTLQEPSKPETMPENIQINFSVYKLNLYRRQKRVLMIDYNLRLLYNIEKGIIKKQFSFKSIKSCEHVEGQKISISFLEHHDYELEATSAEDRMKIIKLLNQIIKNNIYETHQTHGSNSYTPQPETGVIKEGQLELQKGGLASVKWNRYCVELRKGELSFQRLNLGDLSEQLGLTPNVIYLSDGNASVHKEVGNGSFTVITKKNCYLFRIPVTDQLQSTEDVTTCRNEWIDSIDKCCLHWKRLSQFLGENNLTDALPSIPKEPADQTMSKQSDLPANSKLEEGKEQKKGAETEGEEGTEPPSAVKKAAGEWPLERVAQKENTEKEAEEELASAVKKTIVESSLERVAQNVDAGKEAEEGKRTGLTFGVKETAVESSLERVALPVVTQRLPDPMLHPPPPPAPAIPAPPPLLPKKSRSIIKKMKAFHWDVVAPEKIQKSIWGQSNAAKIQLHYPRLVEQFSTQDILTHSVNDFSTHQQILLNHKVAHNFNIFLRSFPVKVSELRGKLLIIQEENGGLSNEHIASLRRYVPTPNDIEKYKTYKGSQADLHIVDQYMMEMCNISYLSHRLDLILSMRELPVTVSDLQPLIRQKIKACSQLLDSKLFVSVLEYLLAVGNFLNTNAGKAKAKGFCLSSLTKVVQLRGKDRKFTLLHALVEQITSQEPALTNFPQELTEFEEVPGDSIKGLIAEVDVLKSDLTKTGQHKKLFKPKNKMCSDAQFYKGLKALIQKYEAELSDLTKQCDEMKKLYNSVLVKFGEPQNRDSQELFEWISSFIKDFRRAVADRRNYKLETTQT
ncbi:protein diaphanous homolog 3 [Scyliorhinus canicula]|uniref:protein diaphanous homolog 3 n=1 Tax=Scyliorhinus canicula TaxID=7830 RepID=UPI0018F47384|nr:protein diaphanous homolog 3 [Scyliorhinus canicula]